MKIIVNPLNPDRPIPYKSVVLVGMPGAGKSSIGRRLAGRLDLPFVDSDAEIEAASSMKTREAYEKFGESEYRAGERRILHRLVNGDPHVISTGGGTFTDPETRQEILEKALSVWLRVDFDILFERVSRRKDRPILNQHGAAKKEKLQELFNEREPFFKQANIVVPCDNRPTDQTVQRVLQALNSYAEGL